jgi:sulfatase modifying factor 1
VRRPTCVLAGVFKDCDECPEMVVIPAGSFQMGSPLAEADRNPQEESPQHNVVIGHPFALAKTEITRNQYAIFVGATGHNSGNSCRVFKGTKWEEDPNLSWRNPGYPQQGDHPVACINWNDAQAYVTWLSQKTGKRYRLPSEAEWEYAARAGTSTARYWGDDSSRACAFANIADQSLKNQEPEWLRAPHGCNDGHTYTAPVGKFRPNSFGLHDMIGNVMEWVEDCYNPSYVGAPTDGRAWTSGDCKQRRLRGGSWINQPKHARAANRTEEETSKKHLFMVGFRPARVLP